MNKSMRMITAARGINQKRRPVKEIRVTKSYRFYRTDFLKLNTAKHFNGRNSVNELIHKEMMTHFDKREDVSG